MQNKPQERTAAYQSRLYFSLMNELFIKIALIETLIVVTFLVLWFNLNIYLENNIGNEYNQAFIQVKEATNNIQTMMLVDHANEQINTMNYQADLIRRMMGETKSYTIIDLVPMENVDKNSEVGFHVDKFNAPSFASLTPTLQNELRLIKGNLTAWRGILNYNRNNSNIVAASVSKNIGGQIISAMIFTDNSNLSASHIFSRAEACYSNSDCVENCVENGEFKFACLFSVQGLVVSPLNFSEQVSQDKASVFSYVVNFTQDTVIALHFSVKIQDMEEVNNMHGGMYAVFAENPTHLSQDRSLIYLENRMKEAVSYYWNSESDSSFSVISEKLFERPNPSLINFKPDSNRRLWYTKVTNLFADRLTILSSIIIITEAYTSPLLASDHITNIAIEIALFLLIYTFSLYIIHK